MRGIARIIEEHFQTYWLALTLRLHCGSASLPSPRTIHPPLSCYTMGAEPVNTGDLAWPHKATAAGNDLNDLRPPPWPAAAPHAVHAALRGLAKSVHRCANGANDMAKNRAAIRCITDTGGDTAAIPPSMIGHVTCPTRVKRPGRRWRRWKHGKRWGEP